MEIEQPLSSTQCYLQPDVPWEDRVRSIEQLVIQRLVRHEFVDQQPLRASIGLRGAVADELDEVRVLDDAQEVDLGQPFLVPLNKITESNGRRLYISATGVNSVMELHCDLQVCDTWRPLGLSLLTATAVPSGGPLGSRRTPL